MNKVFLIGRVGQEPEIRETSGGKKFASFSLATSERWRDQATGERKERTDWHNVVVWAEGLAKVVEAYVSKGDMIAVEGRLETRKWQDKDGNDRYTTEVVLRQFGGTLELMPSGSGGKGDRDNDRGRDDRRSASRTSRRDERLSDDLDDEIPF